MPDEGDPILFLRNELAAECQTSETLRQTLLKVEAERDRLRQEVADAAALRKAFLEASHEYGMIFEHDKRPRPDGWKPKPEDVKAMKCWEKMYAASRDTCCGLEMLAEVEQLRRERDYWQCLHGQAVASVRTDALKGVAP
jgi:hypothetical protein